MSKVVKWQKINCYISERKLDRIHETRNNFRKMEIIVKSVSSRRNLDIDEVMNIFAKLAKENYFTLDDLCNLGFSERLIDEIAIKKYFTDEEVMFISQMNYQETKGITVIGRAYAECFDKTDNPLSRHSGRISDCLETEEEKTVALLHDIVEDGYLTFNNLRQLGFSETVVEAVKILTRDKNKYPDYKDYINSIIESRNLIALKVKFWDMEDNQSPYRVKGLDEEKKYKATHKYKPFIPLVVLAIKELEDEEKLERKLRLVA